MSKVDNTDWPKLAAMMTIKRGSRATLSEKLAAKDLLLSRGWTEAMVNKTWTSSKLK